MALKDHSLSGVPRETALVNLDILDELELLSLRAQIDSRLNLGTIREIDLGHELTLQLRTVKALQQAASDDLDTPFGQKAQTAMAVQRLLQDLVKMQTEIHNSEFAKALEGMVIKAFALCEAAADPTLAGVLKQVKDLFFEQYESLQASASE
jgi:hypothetical protein